MQTLTITFLMTLLLTGSVLGQESKNYFIAAGNLVDKTNVKELTGVLRQKNLWIIGADRQMHPASVVLLDESTRGVFVMDYRPATAVGSKVRISAVQTNPIAHPGTDVRNTSGGLDSSIDPNQSAKCYAAVKPATAIDYQIAQRKKQSASE